MARARIEFVTLGSGPGHDSVWQNCVKAVHAVANLAVTTTVTVAANRPVAPAFPTRIGVARVTALDAAVIVAWGVDPTASETANGLRIEAGATEAVPMRSGDKLSFIEVA